MGVHGACTAWSHVRVGQDRGAGWGRLMEWVGVKGKEILLGWELGETL